MTDWDEILNVSTESADFSIEDAHNYGYDPTPYVVLERLVESGYLTEDSVVVDYGCGKGRVGFFLNNQVGCRVVGVDRSLKMIECAQTNLKSFGGSDDIVFVHSNAEDFILDDVDCIYLFNPFSTRVFRKVLERVGESYLENPREILVFFYYSTIEYKLYLPTEIRLELLESIEFTSDEVNGSADAKLSVFNFKGGI